MRRDGLRHPILPECETDCMDHAITPSFPICPNTSPALVEEIGRPVNAGAALFLRIGRADRALVNQAASGILAFGFHPLRGVR